MQNIYVTGNDPLMRTPSYSNPSDLDLEIIRLQQAQQQLEQKDSSSSRFRFSRNKVNLLYGMK